MNDTEYEGTLHIKTNAGSHTIYKVGRAVFSNGYLLIYKEHEMRGIKEHEVLEFHAEDLRVELP